MGTNLPLKSGHGRRKQEKQKTAADHEYETTGRAILTITAEIITQYFS